MWHRAALVRSCCKNVGCAQSKWGWHRGKNDKLTFTIAEDMPGRVGRAGVAAAAHADGRAARARCRPRGCLGGLALAVRGALPPYGRRIGLRVVDRRKPLPKV